MLKTMSVRLQSLLRLVKKAQLRSPQTWQGVVQLHNEAVPFRSALELLNLLDDALWDGEEKNERKERDTGK